MVTAQLPTLLASLALALAGCRPNFRECAPVEPALLAGLPDKLSETGLFADGQQLAPGVTAFTPRFSSWTDGATKRRWIYLPPGTRIDTSDPNVWNFRGEEVQAGFRDGGRAFVETTGEHAGVH